MGMMEDQTEHPPISTLSDSESTALQDGVPMDRGFVVGAVVGLLILITIPLLANHFRDAEETNGATGTSVELPTQSEGTGPQ